MKKYKGIADMIHTDRYTLFLADCMDIFPRLHSRKIDAVITDPPYGIDYDASKSTQKGIQSYKQFEGERSLFNPIPFLCFPDVILFGCNHYCNAIPPKQGQWYFWDKVTRNSLKVRIAEGEFMWHKKGTKPRAFRHLWSGAYRASEAGKKRVHPTQKPIALMRWCIDMIDGQLIFDPFMGSGTTGVAAMCFVANYLSE